MSMVTEVDVRAMLQHARNYSPGPVRERYMVETTHRGRSWIVIVEPDSETRALVVVTVFEHER